ncbi:TetR/AcrR family transcriptional regulator [Streptomyces galbus]|uniref:TetR/AcrR family transcriptional regulator n=1 Tax=Streptomyces galbus TaxID=33898 RepID=A0A4U5X3W6_STRGB|nr:TetR/AcrR family transcriptional regulator [Streptomyces galbus]TKT08046.1 TetR/AcrR family transcriptional regulator [Streptomyces galbus]GHD42404.1 TetR family transcriptional regulator [Streptomyces galbus]
MPRVSRERAAQTRRDVVAAASRLFRQRGTGVSLSEVTAEVGLTNGGFYKHFPSKEALISEATDQAFEDLRRRLDDFMVANNGDHEAARAALIDYYLSPAHRDDLAAGCPASGFAADVVRGQLGEDTKDHYVRGVRELTAWIGGAATDPTPETDSEARSRSGDLSDEAVATLCTMVGGLMLSRATVGSPLSERFLSQARQALLDTKPPKAQGPAQGE